MQAVRAKNPIVSTIASSFKALLAYNFGFIRESVQEYKGMMANVAPQFFNTAAAPSWYLYGSLTYYEYYRQTDKRKHLNKARKWRRCLEQIQARGGPNVRFVSLLHAEERSLQKRSEIGEIASAYDTAIGDMADEKWVQFEALANERAGFVLAKRGGLTEARQYFGRALELYRNEWGATAKYEWLQDKCAQYLVSSNVNIPSQQVIGEILMLSIGEGKD